MKGKQKNTGFMKRKLFAAVSMLLVATILMTATSYAWLVLSVAPEVTGITTNIGANGALEIVLLTTETRENLDLIRTSTNQSLKGRDPSANNTWGNLIDLSYAEYGLSDVHLMPSRLKVIANGDDYVVGSNLLSVPVYAYDGRIEKLTDDTLSAAHNSGEFSLTMGQPEFGVRVIGTTDTLSVQGSAIALAKSNIRTYTQSARNTATSALNNNGDELFSIVLSHAMDSEKTYNDTELKVLKSLLDSLQGSLEYTDLSLRQGIVAYAASEISDKDTFTMVKDQVMNTSKPLNELWQELDGVKGVPQEYENWIVVLSKVQNDLNAAKNASEVLNGGVYTWENIRSILNYIMNMDYVYINDTLYKDFDVSNAGSLMGSAVTLTMAPGSGVFADIAAFVDNYSSSVDYIGTNIEMKTAFTGEESYLKALSVAVEKLEAADDSTGTQEKISLTSTYGYAVDLAFRCNAANPDLLLQTTPENRVYDESISGPTMGGGSYMEFSTKDSEFSIDKMTQLMDAIRVAFIDDHNNILGVAKLNTSNRSIIDGVINSPLYLYDYSISGEDGSIIMGERRLGDNLITELTQNVAKAVTAVVWLDGDIVDNTMVSATEVASLYGVLNLQFSTSANLIPADDSQLKNITADKSELGKRLDENSETVEKGQGTYTTVSWNAYITAYRYAEDVYNNSNANDSQIYNAANNLIAAEAELEEVSPDALQDKVKDVRNKMGNSENIARYVIRNEDGSVSVVGNEEHTQQVHDGWNIVGEVYQVDYAQNLQDEGNGIKTQIYTDTSWSALAAAVYDAEATLMNEHATNGQLNAALTALNVAEKSLQRRVFYKSYEYNGNLYYEAICNANDKDTYGKWYDSNFKRIVADITILNLDAYASPVEIAKIQQNEFVSWNVEKITPTIEILDSVYQELKGEEIKGANWSAFDVAFFQEVMEQRHINTLNTLMGIVQDEDLDVSTDTAKELLERDETVYADEARNEIERLNAEITVALEEKQQKEQNDNQDITVSQRILLTTAVNTAKTVDFTGENADNIMKELQTAVSNAENVLTKEDPAATMEKARESLDAINKALKDAGKEEITEYNTLTHSLPVISELFEVVYPLEHPGVTLARTALDDEGHYSTGETTIRYIAVTTNGILIDISKNITFYASADEAVTVPDTHDMHEGGMHEFTAELKYSDAAENIAHKEHISRCIWASEDTDIAIVSGGNDEKCTVTAVKAGVTYITLTIETQEGNTYPKQIEITVT